MFPIKFDFEHEQLPDGWVRVDKTVLQDATLGMVGKACTPEHRTIVDRELRDIYIGGIEDDPDNASCYRLRAPAWCVLRVFTAGMIQSLPPDLVAAVQQHTEAVIQRHGGHTKH